MNSKINPTTKYLSQVPAGTRVKILKIDAGRGATVNLSNLGLYLGNVVKITRKSIMHGPMIVNSRGTDIAIGYGLACKIVVSEE